MAGVRGRSGRRPLPVSLHKLRGTWRADRHGRRLEIQPSAAAPRCPSWLGEYAKAAWAELAPDLHAMGVLTELDRGAFTCLCVAIEHRRRATEIVNREGMTYTNSRGRLVKHPAVGMEQRATTEILAWAREFGLSPASRSRLGLRLE